MTVLKTARAGRAWQGLDGAGLAGPETGRDTRRGFPALLLVRSCGAGLGGFLVMERAGAAVGLTHCPKTRG